MINIKLTAMEAKIISNILGAVAKLLNDLMKPGSAFEIRRLKERIDEELLKL